MPSLVSRTRSYGCEKRIPRKRATASQNHSGSSIERATRSSKPAMPTAAMKRATLLSRSRSASGRQTTAGAVTGEESTRAPRAGSVRRVAAANADDSLVWIDLEMTGLDVERDVIVEIACIVTDAELTALDDGIQLIVHADGERLAQ